MPGRRILHHLRFTFMLCMGLLIGTVVGGIYYLNQSGLNDEWRGKIAYELEKLGVVSDFESLSFDPTRGLIARGVRVYATDEREDVVARLEHLVIDVDKTKLMRGKVRVNKVSLKKADISLPIDPDDPDGPRVTINKLRGNIYLPDKRNIEARDVSGSIAGIKVNLDARIWSEHAGLRKQPKPLKDVRVARIKLIARIIQEIHQWHWPEGSPPELDLYLEGNVDNPDSSRLDFTLTASELERTGVILRDIEIKGDYKNRMITLDRIAVSDNSGKISARAAYHTTQRKGRFEANSTLHVQKLARQLFNVDILQQITFSTPPTISCTGELHFDTNFKPDVLISGTATIDDFSCLGSRFKRLITDFSSHGRDTFLTGLHVTHSEGELKGRILLKNNTIRYEADSTLPVSAYTPFLYGSPIEQTLKRAKFTQATKVYITAEGTMNRDDLTQWAAKGHASFTNFSFRGTDMYSLSGDYEMSQLHSRFTNVNANFDYSNYILRQKHGGPKSARMHVDSITVDAAKHLTRITRLKGTAWPAPVVRLFAPDVASHIEEYRFHRPPNLSASGTFDHRSSGKQTYFTIYLNKPGSMNYDFLGKPLTLRRLRARVRIRGDRVDVNNLSFQTFQGSCSGNIRIYTSAPRRNRYSGEMQWRRLHLKDIGKLYKFDNAERGLLTGRIDFSGQNDNIGKLNGKGNISLEEGNLFSVPILGPLTPVIGAVLGKRNPTREHAKHASSSFNLRNGVIYSNDFLATTRSLKFTGEGNINLNKKQIDILMRMNARGLFGMLTFPLQPIMKGLFQFKGTGAISAPKWRPTVFTPPKRGKNDPIYRKPPKARVIRE